MMRDPELNEAWEKHHVARGASTLEQVVCEGAKFELAKPLTPTFAVNHNFWLGGSLVDAGEEHHGEPLPRRRRPRISAN